MYPIQILFFKCFIITYGYSWDLNNFGISENYYVSSIAIYKTKAFIALPRSVCHNNISNPTIVEVPWTSFKPFSTNIKQFRPKILEFQKWGDCKDIQDAVSLDMEPKKPKLWILDKGSEFCMPKIVSYNVIYNSLSGVSELKNVPRENLNSIVIDPKQDDVGYKMYIGNAGDNSLLVFSSGSLKWWKINLREMTDPVVSISPDFLAISKTDPVLYITGRKSLELFSLDLNELKNLEEKPSYETEDEIIEINVTLIGRKMGISTGLQTDFKAGLSYYMVRDYVVVRWLTGFPMTAEYHSVLIQSFEQLPYVSELFTGPQFGLWALVNPLPLDQCHGQYDNTAGENVAKLETRVVKLLKYNRFLNDIF